MRALSPEAAAPYFYPEFDPECIEMIRDQVSEADAIFMLGAECWGQSERTLEAVEILRLAVDAGSPRALEAIGDALDWLGAYEQAIPYLERAHAEGVGDQAWLAGVLGHARRELGVDGRDVDDLLREGGVILLSGVIPCRIELQIGEGASCRLELGACLEYPGSDTRSIRTK